MDRADLAGEVAKRCRLRLVDAARAVIAIFDPEEGVISEALQQGEKVQIIGFGTFLMVLHHGRTWQSPHGPVRRGDRLFVRMREGKVLSRWLNREGRPEPTPEEGEGP